MRAPIIMRIRVSALTLHQRPRVLGLEGSDPRPVLAAVDDPHASIGVPAALWAHHCQPTPDGRGMVVHEPLEWPT